MSDAGKTQDKSTNREALADNPPATDTKSSGTEVTTATLPLGTDVDPPPPVPGVKVPDIESLHRDLAVANSYRQEFIKSLILIAGALFAFSVSFRPELRAIAHEELFWAAWIGLGISMAGGFGQLAAWERFYASYQRFEWKKISGKPYRNAINCGRKAALFLQVAGFIVGVGALGSFTALNLGNVEHTKPPAAAIGATQGHS
jgi:hypothetical protein